MYRPVHEFIRSFAIRFVDDDGRMASFVDD